MEGYLRCYDESEVSFIGNGRWLHLFDERMEKTPKVSINLNKATVDVRSQNKFELIEGKKGIFSNNKKYPL